MARTKRKSGKENATPFSKCLSELVKKETDNNISLSDIAKKMGVPKRSLDDWKDNASAANTDSLPKIAEYYGVSYDFLMGASTDPARAPAAADELGLDPEVVRMLVSWKEERQEKTEEFNKYRSPLNLMNALLLSPWFINALRDFYVSIKLSSLMGNDPSNIDDMFEYREKEGPRAMRQIDDLRDKGKSTFLLETTIATKANLTAEDIAEFYLQQGLNRVRKAIENLAEDGGDENGKSRK